MFQLKKLAAVAALVMVPLSPAQALCIYKGVDNARTTLDQEFGDSRWVVRARVLSAVDHWTDDDDEAEPWTLYRLEILRAYKGAPPRRITFFTERNSGGFYMDRPWGGGHDIGGEYLLFLNPLARFDGRPQAARGATFVNYNCGLSRPWAEVSRAEARRLAALAERR